MLINTEGIIIQMPCEEISVLGRVTSGVKLMNLSGDAKVASIAKVRESSVKIEEDGAENQAEDFAEESDEFTYGENSEEALAEEQKEE